MTKIDDLNKNLERIGDLIEKAIDPTNFQVEVPPPQCPNCKRINPRILIQESEIQGPFIEYVLQATCLHCSKSFYGLPIGWNITLDREKAILAAQENRERIKNVGYNA